MVGIRMPRCYVSLTSLQSALRRSLGIGGMAACYERNYRPYTASYGLDGATTRTLTPPAAPSLVHRISIDVCRCANLNMERNIKIDISVDICLCIAAKLRTSVHINDIDIGTQTLFMFVRAVPHFLTLMLTGNAHMEYEHYCR